MSVFFQKSTRDVGIFSDKHQICRYFSGKHQICRHVSRQVLDMSTFYGQALDFFRRNFKNFLSRPGVIFAYTTTIYDSFLDFLGKYYEKSANIWPQNHLTYRKRKKHAPFLWKLIPGVVGGCTCENVAVFCVQLFKN